MAFRNITWSSWGPSAALVHEEQPGWQNSIFQQAPGRHQPVASLCSWHLAWEMQTCQSHAKSLVNLVTSSYTPIPPPQHHPPCSLFPRDHKRMGRLGMLSIPACQVVTVASHQLQSKCEQGLTLTSLSGCESRCVITASVC